MTTSSISRMPKVIFGFAAAAGMVCLLFNCSSPPKEERPNVLFVIVDDLRPELGCYGNPEIKTPNFDPFAKESMMFHAPTVRRQPAHPHGPVFSWDNVPTRHGSGTSVKFRQIHPDAVTMPQHFDRYGYHTVSMGKMFHNHMPDPVSFNEPDLRPPNTPPPI